MIYKKRFFFVQKPHNLDSLKKSVQNFFFSFSDTDGGRIALTMFGRRGTVIVTFFTAVGLLLSGLFGGDPSDILLYYILFATIWQRQLEVPPTNETDELDFGRGLIGITAAIVVGLTLIPMS